MKMKKEAVEKVSKKVAVVLETVLKVEVNITVRQSRQSGVARATCPD